MATLNYWDGTNWSPVLNGNDIIKMLGGSTSSTATEAVKSLGGMTTKEIEDAIAAAKKEILTGESTENLNDTYDTLLEIAKWIESDKTNSAGLAQSISNNTDSINENTEKIEKNIDDIAKNASDIKTLDETIKALDVTDAAVTNKYVSKVSQVDGKISVERVELPVKSVTQSGTGTEGSILVNGSTEVPVYTHPSITATANTDSNSTNYNKSISYIDSLTVNNNGHVTAYNTKTTTLPKQTYYGTCSTAASTAEKVVSIEDISTDALDAGLTIHVKMSYANSASSPTIKLNNFDSKSIKRYGTTAVGTNSTTSWNAGSIVSFTYDGTNWIINNFLNTTYTTDSTYVDTAGGTATKVGTCSGLAAYKNNTWYQILIKSGNTATEALTLNINSLGAKSIYINGEASSSTNYTLPAGNYFVYYADDKFYFRTDGHLENNYGICSTGATEAIKVVTIAGFETAVGTSIKIKMSNDNTANDLALKLNGYKINDEYPSIIPSNASWSAGSVLDLTFDGSSWIINGYAELNSVKDNLQGQINNINNNINSLDNTVNGTATQNGVTVSTSTTQTDGKISATSVSLTGIGTAASKNSLSGTIALNAGSDNLVSSSQVSDFVQSYTSTDAFKSSVASAAGNAIQNDPSLISGAVAQIQSGASEPTSSNTSSMCMMYIQYA